MRDCYRRRWWYQLTHVCRRWQNLILGLSSYLGLSLVCTYGTPVADMLAHSPPLPLVINFFDDDRIITAKDEEAMILALKQRDRVCRIRIQVPDMQEFAMAMEEKYPILECLIMGLTEEDENSIPLTFPTTFQAPRLHHLVLISFSLPIESRLLTTAVGLVTFSLYMIQPSSYFQPNVLVYWISFMPQLEMLIIDFLFPVSIRDMEQQVTRPPATTPLTPVTIPNLRLFRLQGDGAYVEEVVRRINTPCLQLLEIELLNELTFPLPCLLHFIDTTKSLRFNSAELILSEDKVQVEMSLPDADADACAIRIHVTCCHFDRQVSSVAQIFNMPGKVSTLVENLTLISRWPFQEHNDVDRTEWRKILRSFSNVETLYFGDGLVGDLSRCLRLEGGEDPLELLPGLQQLVFPMRGYTTRESARDAFASFIDARQNAGCPVAIYN